MSAERRKVLEMLALGKITAEDAEKLLDKLAASGSDPGAPEGQTGEESWHVLADPEGNEFCLLRRTVKPAS